MVCADKVIEVMHSSNCAPGTIGRLALIVLLTSQRAQGNLSTGEGPPGAPYPHGHQKGNVKTRSNSSPPHRSSIESQPLGQPQKLPIDWREYILRQFMYYVGTA